MNNYDYRKAIKEDIEIYIKHNNLQISDLNAETLYNQLIEEDTVTGWGYFYYDTEEKCREYLTDNYILLKQAVQEYCEEDEMDNEYALDLFIGNAFASYYDSIIRRYLLKEVLNEVIEEHKNGKI